MSSQESLQSSYILISFDYVIGQSFHVVVLRMGTSELEQLEVLYLLCCTKHAFLLMRLLPVDVENLDLTITRQRRKIRCRQDLGEDVTEVVEHTVSFRAYSSS